MGGKMDSQIQVKGKNTPWPEDARPNPYLSEQFEQFNERLNCNKKIDAHTKAVGGMTLHAKK
jgi:hypothetical protein